MMIIIMVIVIIIVIVTTIMRMVIVMLYGHFFGKHCSYDCGPSSLFSDIVNKRMDWKIGKERERQHHHHHQQQQQQQLHKIKERKC